MKVTFWYKDGSFLDVQVPDMPTPSQAIKYAKEQLTEENRENIDLVQVEDDFL